MTEQRMIPWDVIIEILNKYQSYNPGHAAEHVNKFVNDEIYEWVNSQIDKEDVEVELIMETFPFSDGYAVVGYCWVCPSCDYTNSFCCVEIGESYTCEKCSCSFISGVDADE